MNQFYSVCVALLLLGILIVQAKFPPESCGEKDSVTSKIVGGVESEPGAWPWQVYMQLVRSNSALTQRCGGILISKRWVLSAAHCTIGVKPEGVRLVLGEHNKLIEEDFAIDHAVSRVINHPEYSTYPIITFDICLIKLAGEAVFSKYVYPICLPTQGDKVPPDTICWITGWGNTENILEGAIIMRENQVPIRNTSECQKTYNNRLEDQHLCASYKDSGNGTCQGDSGGPLFCRNNATSPYVVRGITSFAIGCSGHIIYTRVSEFSDWIDETIKENTGDDPFFSIPQKPCGSLITSDALFRLPVDNSTQLYHPNSTCTWTVKPSANVTRVFFLFTEKFVVQTEASTCADYVQVVTDNGKTIHTELCGHSIPKGVAIPIDANTTAINVTFVSDGSKEFEGFALNVTFNYDVVTANSTPTVIKINGYEERNITTPGYPSSTLENDYNSYYQFVADPGNLIRIFIDVDTEECCDYIEFYNGNTSFGKLQGKLRKRIVISNTNVLSLRIVTDFLYESVGFSANYSQFDPTCGEDLMANSTIQSLTSPDYSPTTTSTTTLGSISLTSSTVGLMNIRDCHWIITANPGETVAFLLHDLQVATSGDWLIIAHGFTILAEFSVSCKNKRYVSKENQIQVILHTESGENNGLSAEYFSTKTGSSEIFELEGNSSQVVTSPGYPFATARSLVCYYTFQVQTNHFVVITFEGNLGSCCSYIQLTDGYTFLGRYYKNLTYDVVSSDFSRVTLTYVTYSYNYDSNDIGFQATCSQYNNTCGKRAEANLSTQFITSPGFPGAYPTNQYCYWLITARRDRRVLLLIHKLKLNDGDFLVLTTAIYYTELFTGGRKESRTLSSLNSIFRVMFTSEVSKSVPRLVDDNSSAEAGFNISYKMLSQESLCGDTVFNLSESNDVFVSPNYPLPSPSNLYCSYQFEAESGYYIEIMLNGDTEACCDYVEVMEDGLSTQRLQGIISSAKITSSSNRLTLIYYTDAYTYSKGYSGTYRQFKPTCGEKFQATNLIQWFSPPSSLVSRNSDDFCLWYIYGVPDKLMQLTVTSSGLESNTFYLEIESSAGNVMKVTSEFTFPLQQTISSTRVRIQFYKYNNATSGTFNASYVILDQCYNKCALKGGYCNMSGYDSSSCLCEDGYTGDGLICSDVNECDEDKMTDVCDVNAECSNSVGSFTCTCKSEYLGDGQNCNAVVNVSATLNPAFQYTPELQNKSSEAYMNLSRLVTKQLKMKFENVRVSDVSFYEGSVVFVASLEILNNSAVQAVLDSFNNTIGDTSLFETSLSTDISPCIFVSCGLNEICRITSDNNYICTCSEGYINSSGICEPITCNDCSTFASCNSHATITQCVCKPGFTGDGLVCDDIDECSTYSDPCPNAVCINYAGTFECQCNPETYKKNGICISQCIPGYCLNEATCIERNLVGPPVCLCKEGYAGKQCEEKIEEDSGIWIAIGVLAGVVFILLVMVVVMMMRLRRNNSSFSLEKHNEMKF